jgi:hypothetical protein
MKKKYKYRLKETIRKAGISEDIFWCAQFIDEEDFEKYGKDDMFWSTISNFLDPTSKEEALKDIERHKNQEEPVIKYHEA